MEPACGFWPICGLKSKVSICAGPPDMLRKITRCARERTFGGLASKLAPASHDIAKYPNPQEAVWSIWRREMETG